MPVRKISAPRRGRPRGSRTFDASVASAFGSIVRQTRLDAGVSQEELAHLAQVERSYLGRLERGESQPTLFVVLKVAAALGCEGRFLVGLTEDALIRSTRARPG
ncbi:MAG: helix-turn-helix transcriptional regulator [Piscinibacter sp.]|uniref:helix-turn-helix domain-containing protein n=1 Tax=Piscinibacter sp. TaxID=1903157 RepID=UPI001B567E16|nr:helix-turn-helix transcriptional regulator [Piscinibacter sp.]MBP5988637.1 helix-turn-helix transcriptional regulator [Piscinibacter sp.]MBP6025874.1 helix-turn-helix transcriptional regulator [Piscinibacter sp.]